MINVETKEGLDKNVNPEHLNGLFLGLAIHRGEFKIKSGKGFFKFIHNNGICNITYTDKSEYQFLLLLITKYEF